MNRYTTAALIVLLAGVLALVIVTRADAADLYANKQFAGRRLGNQAWQYKWQVWLPPKWQRVFHCETPTHGYYINWQHRSRDFQGGAGFHKDSWDRFKPVSWWPREAYLATPWQQYQTALAIHRRYGFSGWGCRGA